METNIKELMNDMSNYTEEIEVSDLGPGVIEIKTFTDNTLKVIDRILKWQSENLNEASQFNISIKSLNKEDKVKVLKHIMKNEDVVDSFVILNIFNFIKGFNTFDNSFFESKEVYVNDMEEYLDIKYELKDELNELMRKIAVYYLSVIKSCDKIDNSDERMVVIPLMIQRIFYICDFYSLSVILNKIKGINIDDTYVVNNAMSFINAWSYNQVVTKQVSIIMDNALNIKDNNIKE